MVGLTSGDFSVNDTILSDGLYAVVGADGFEKIKVRAPSNILTPVTVIGKFTFAG